jgi:glutamate carboxypeptidase
MAGVAMLLALSPHPALGQGLSPIEREIADYVEAHTEEAIAFLQRIVDINSGTMNHDGVREVGRLFREELDALGFRTRWIDMPPEVNRAGHLFAERQGDRGKHVLLIGHLDTVFEEDSPFQSFARDGWTATGPGVEDMKGGDVVMLFALKALHETGALDGASITVAYTGDEEMPGHPLSASRSDLIEAGRAADIALGFEGGVGSPNTATIARRGSSGWKLTVEGVRAHSSGIFDDAYGAGAVFETARILNAFYEDVRGEEYLTFNPGVVLGGTDVVYDQANTRGTAFGKTNVIAQTVVVEGGLRFITDEQKGRARAKMKEIVARSLPQTSAEISFSDSYPAMPPTAGNQALFEALEKVNRDLGQGAIKQIDPGARGAADISFVAADVDGLAGLGVFGSAGHTVDESVDLRSLPLITARAAILIHRLTGEDR